MRPLELCLVSCILLFCDTAKTKSDITELRSNVKSISSPQGYAVRQYFEGGTTSGKCRTNLKGKLFMTINGNIVTGRKARISISSSNTGNNRYLHYTIALNRNTTLGDYRCNVGNHLILEHRIGYILCDPGRITPEKVCHNGEFCVINESHTSCQSQTDCEGVEYPRECAVKKPVGMRRGQASCSIYSDAKNIPNGYYLQSLKENGTGECKMPALFHNGKRIEFLSTIPINGYGQLEQLAIDLANGTNDVICKVLVTGIEDRVEISAENITQLVGLFSQKESPIKAPVVCTFHPDAIDSAHGGRLDFFILFYETKGLQFYIVQAERNITANVTNSTEVDTLLEPSLPFNCTVMTGDDFFIKAYLTEVIPTLVSMPPDADSRPNPKVDSAKMEYKYGPNGTYVCFGAVYFYEVLPNSSFKLLYTEKREVLLHFNMTTIEGIQPTTPIYSTESTTNGSEITVHRSTGVRSTTPVYPTDSTTSSNRITVHGSTGVWSTTPVYPMENTTSSSPITVRRSTDWTTADVVVIGWGVVAGIMMILLAAVVLVTIIYHRKSETEEVEDNGEEEEAEEEE